MRPILYLVPFFLGMSVTGEAQVLSTHGGTLFINNSAVLTVQGDLLHTAGSLLVNRGGITLTGNLTNHQANLTDEGGSLVFSGSSAQTVSGSVPFPVRDVRINNPVGIVLTTSLKISREIVFTNGILTADSEIAPLVFLSGASVSQATPPSSASQAAGYVVKEGTGAFTFPVGNGIRYQPAGIDLTGNSAGISVRYRKGRRGRRCLYRICAADCLQCA